jgi:hypothetical protein
MARLNKKILCFVDEYGTAGSEGFSLGCVMIWAHECGKADKAFSDLLPASVNEVHAVNWNTASLQGILARLAQTEAPGSLLMLNKRFSSSFEDRPIQYAKSLIEAVKVSIGRFSKIQNIRMTVGNVEVIVDTNEHNTHASFVDHIEIARQSDGRFRAVTRVISLDSTASRMLQLADVVAHSRTWIDKAEYNAKGLHENYKIEVL